jgi:hypothetical protein
MYSLVSLDKASPPIPKTWLAIEKMWPISPIPRDVGDVGGPSAPCSSVPSVVKKAYKSSRICRVRFRFSPRLRGESVALFPRSRAMSAMTRDHGDLLLLPQRHHGINLHRSSGRDKHRVPHPFACERVGFDSPCRPRFWFLRVSAPPR